MKLDRFYVKNFRRLEDVEIKLNEAETIFVGPNNSGKTSASMVFRLFVNQNRDFRIHDFSSMLIKKIDEIGVNGTKAEDMLPSIDMDLWFTVNPDTEYGKVANFLPSLTKEYTEIGIRISFSVNDFQELMKYYNEVKNLNQDKEKSLSTYLSEEDHLKKYFSLKYFKLECTKDSFNKNCINASPIDKKEGHKSLKSLITVDFVDAQRSIDDNEAAKSTKLSTVLSDYYKANLEKPENDNEAISVIDKSNESLSEHYKKQFEDLIKIIGDLGFPSANDRGIQILSTLSPEAALKGNTALLYVDKEFNHQLPEAYNGLGFKNLIYMAVQVSHFQRKWLAIRHDKPLSHLIFIEEPEVHLHAQVQQTFIRQIRKIIESTADVDGGDLTKPQLIISTHSSHIIDEGDFTVIRYFRRCASSILNSNKRKIATQVLNLANFNSEEHPSNNIKFLKKYLKLTHCDLFFSDGAILVEGAVEKLLLPNFIEKTASELKNVYLTILEVGGAYAHLFVQLLDFIGLPTLIISDLDSVNPNENRKICRADNGIAITSNQTISRLVKKSLISDLLNISSQESACYVLSDQKSIVFQNPVSVLSYGEGFTMIPRTFEESFIYENLELARDEKIDVFVKLGNPLDFENDYNRIYKSVSSNNYKKTEFALNLMDNEEDWKTPKYVVDGLKWLSSVVKSSLDDSLGSGQSEPEKK